MLTLSLSLMIAAVGVDPATTRPDPMPRADAILRAVPADAVAVFSARDLDGFRARGAENAWGRFFADEEMGELAEFVGAAAGPLMEQAEMPFNPLDLCASIHGSVAVFVSPTGPGLEPGFGVLIDPGEERGAFEDMFDGVLQLMEGELDSSSDSYAGVDLRLFDTGDPTLVVFETGGLVGIVGSKGGHLGLAHGVIDRYSGQDDSEGVAGSAGLAGARQASGGASTFEIFVDVGALIHLIQDVEGEPDAEVMEILDAIGVSRMDWAYGAFEVGAGEDFDMILSLHVPGDSYMAQFMDFLGEPPAGLGATIPAESTGFGLMSYHVWDAYEAVMEILMDRAPDAYEGYQGFLGNVLEEYGLDLEQDLIAQINGDLASFNMTVPEEEVEAATGGMGFGGFAPGGIDQGSAMILGLTEPDVVDLFLEDAMSLIGLDSMVEEEEYQGQIIKSLTFGMPGMGGFHWAFTDDALVFSQFPTCLRASLALVGQEDAPTALTSGPFEPYLEDLPRSSGFSISDTATSVKTLINLAGVLEGLAMLPGMELPEEALDFLTDMPVPDSSLAEKYFEGVIFSTLERGENSLNMRYAGR